MDDDTYWAFVAFQNAEVKEHNRAARKRSR
jgi:hypothetical protein